MPNLGSLDSRRGDKAGRQTDRLLQDQGTLRQKDRYLLSGVDMTRVLDLSGL